jgi:hypothetical protein
MRALKRGTVRRVVGLAATTLSALLVIVPIASADSIKSGAGAQLTNVVVDSSPSCSPTAATIDWGDGTPPSPGSIDKTNGAIYGSHTYGAAGTYNGTVTLTGGDCSAGTQDSLSATVGPAPQFKQCPPVDNNGGCQFLITATNSGTTIQTDGNQPAYDDGGDDALIGIQNNTSKPISSIPLSVPNTALFGFEQDGLCDPGSSPIPSGCTPVSTPGAICRPSDSCAFPAPPGQPAGYTEPDPLSNSTQNGYEGPRNWFSNISSDQSSGRVNFSPALQPGESTYFSLEEPPVGSSLNASATPTGLNSAPPTVSATSANFTGTVNPNGSATTVFFQYGLSSKYHSPNAGPFTQSTQPQSIGGDFSDHFVSGSAGGLDPNAVYEVRLVAQNKNGTSFGPTLFFTTHKAPAPGAPTLGKTFNISAVNGIVLIEVNGHFVPVTQLRQIPANTVIDALHGTIAITAATGGLAPASDAKAKKKKSKKGPKTTTGTFGGGVFKVTQGRSGKDKGFTTLTLVYNAFKGGPTTKVCKAKKAGDTAHIALSSRVLQTLRSKSSGRTRTRGRYAAGTVRGTRWTTTDRCDGTLIKVQQHSVQVTDLVKHKTVLVRAGHQYLARAPGAKKKH